VRVYPFEHFESIHESVSAVPDALRGKMRVENKHAIIAYTQLGIKDPDFIKLLESYEYLTGRVGFG